MLLLPSIRPLSEKDIDTVFDRVGGRRAHPDADRRTLRGSDYIIGKSIIELKLLEDERFEKTEAQAKLAELFGNLKGDRPVVVIDPELLTPSQRREYDTIIRAPIKAAVRSARVQLRQTRNEIDPSLSNVLFIINNGFTTLAHDDLVEQAVGRARNDTREIDAVVIAGCYLHGDGFDAFALWPIDCITINNDRPFREFEDLKRSWNILAENHMTEFVCGDHGRFAGKEAQTDVVFNWEGRTYVKPAIPIGGTSKFFGGRRPRRNHIGFDQVKHTALTIPRLSTVEHRRVRSALQGEPLLESLETWNQHIDKAMLISKAEMPVVPVDVTRGSWEAWKRKNPGLIGLDSLRAHANSVFAARASRIIHSSIEILPSMKLPKRYILAVIELICQDESNDISHIGVFADGTEKVLLANARMGHYTTLSLAAAYALQLGLSKVF